MYAKPAVVLKNTITAPSEVVQNELFEVVYNVEKKRRDRPELPSIPDTRICKTERKAIIKGQSVIWTITLQLQTWASGDIEITCPGAKPVRVTVKEHPKYGWELSAAHRFLVERGLRDSIKCLQPLAYKDGWRMFNDPYNGYFVVVANRTYDGIMSCPVLVYGLKGSCYGSSYKSEPTQFKLFDYYVKKLNALRTSGHKWDDVMVAGHRKAVVTPLLGDTRWAQTEPYNSKGTVMDQTGKRAPVGCVPVAGAQIMRYYRHPEHGFGKYIYRAPDQKEYEVRFSDYSIKWDDIADSYEKKQEREAEPLSDLLQYVGLGCNAKFGGRATSGSMSYLERALECHFGYSSGMYIASNLTDADMVRLIYEEIDASRPCIIDDGNHAFVCDGGDGDFAHFNFGWGGYLSGFYRLDAPAADSLYDLPICGSLVRIKPHVALERHVTLKAEGTLSDMLTRSEKENVTNLKITGPLNCADIRLLRLMAGAPVDRFESPDADIHGSLQILDLSDAVFKGDKSGYIKEDATGHYITSSGYSYDEMTNSIKSYYNKFDFTKMTYERWKDIVGRHANEFDGIRYIREGDKYYAIYFMKKNEVSESMFFRCVNLQTIILPQNVKAVGRNAFAGCYGLINITLPPKVRNIGKGAFAYTPSLQGVGTYGNISVEGTLTKMFEGNAVNSRTFYKVKE